MAILPSGTPGRLPAVPVPAAIRPLLPVVPVSPVVERIVSQPPAPRTPRPGTFVDTWAGPAARAAPGPTAGFAGGTIATLLPGHIGAPAPSAAPAESASRDLARPAPVPLPIALPHPDELPGSTAMLARALRVAIEASGLFYESHLAEWVEGRRSLEDVRGEATLVSAAKVARAEAGEPDPVRNQQVDYLRQGVAGWTLPDPWQERATLWVGEEAPDTWHSAADSARMHLDLDLAGRGRVQVTLRLRGEDLRADVVNGPGTHLHAAELAALAHRLGHIQGTRLAALRIESAPDAQRQSPEHEAWREAGAAGGE